MKGAFFKKRRAVYALLVKSLKIFANSIVSATNGIGTTRARLDAVSIVSWVP